MYIVKYNMNAYKNELSQCSEVCYNSPYVKKKRNYYDEGFRERRQ